jgi:hypothetical protein
MDEKAPTNLYTALLAAQRAMGPVVKNATNPHLHSKYADLSAVLETIEAPLWDNGLLLLQRFTHDQGGAILVTELIHAASGERIASEVPVVSKDPTDPQKIGAAITYYRRYSLLALLGLAPEDDDGHAASQPRPQPAPARNAAPAFATPRAAPTPAPVLPASPNQRANQQREIDAEGYDEEYTWTAFWAWARQHGYQDRHACAVALGKADDVVNGWTPAQIRTALEVAHQRAG